jgi:hypothetical protein
MPRLWLDLTGIAPGSDAAVLVQRLAPVWRERLGERLVLCRRAPGIAVVSWQDLPALTPQPPPLPVEAGWRGRLRDAMALWPQRTRASLRRAAALQRQALATLRRPPPSAVAAAPVDETLPEAGDTWLALLSFGDLSRFHASGVRLVLLAADQRPALRPDWLTPDEAAASAVWRETTTPLLERQLDLWHLAAAAACVPPGPGRTVPQPGFILADGEIGVPGKTPELLLAWRRLHDDRGGLPALVLAGHLGALAADVMAQLRNSLNFGGSVVCLPNPSEVERAGLRQTCAFSMALEPHSAWGRATRDSLAAGVPCLSAMAVPGATLVDPDNVTALADRMRAWIAAPPARPAAASRDWAAVPDAVLTALAR